MKAAGIDAPYISILSDDFLAEVRDLDKKNLAVEALRKLIGGEVRSQSRRNVTQAKAFSERLESAIVLEELITLAKDIRAARRRGEEIGLSDEEIAFYDALADNQSARDIMGEPALRLIAHELMGTIKDNVTVDWMHRDSTRANIRRLVKRILRKYGYPPDLQEAAVQYFPRGTDLSRYSQSDLDAIALRLNQRPRETLGFKTPAYKLQASVAPTH